MMPSAELGYHNERGGASNRHDEHIIQTCIPLLLHSDEQVQRQTTLLLLTLYGTHAFTLLRRRLSDGNPYVRRDAEQALRVLGRQSGHPVDFRPFRGMHVECLGTLRVYIGNQEILSHEWAQANTSRAGRRKVQALLAYLVHRGRSGASADELRAAVWGTAGATGALARTLTALRQTVERFGGEQMANTLLISTNQRYLLAPDAYTSDVRAFEHTIHVAEQTEHDRDLAAAAPVYRHACDLYGGPYLADVDIFADEIEERRTELLNAYLHALERLAEHAYQQGDDEQCLAFCHRGIRFDPADEQLTLWMLRCHARWRNESEIARVFRRYLRALSAPPDDNDAVVRWMRSRSLATDEPRPAAVTPKPRHPRQ